MTPEVQLLPAFVFTCDACGRDTFVRGAVSENPDENEEAQKFFRELIAMTDGIEQADLWDGDMILMPKEVTCPFCNILYQVEAPFMLTDDSFDDDFDDNDYDDEDLFDDEWTEDLDEDDEDDWDDEEDFEVDEDLDDDFV
jgi:hypothetical protein